MEGVPWRRAALGLGATAVVLGGTAVVLRADGYQAVDVAIPRATRWFVDRGNQWAVLVDGFAGETVARIELDAESLATDVAQGAGQAVLVDRSAATTRAIDTAALRVSPPQSLSLVASGDTTVAVGQAGMVAVDTRVQRAVIVTPGDDPVRFETGPLGSGDDTQIAPDGSVWTLADGELARVTTAGREVVAAGLSDAAFALVGNTALLVDVDRGRVQFDRGDWLDLPGAIFASEVVVQRSGPAADCGWIGADGVLQCIGREGVEVGALIDGLQIDSSDLLAVAGDVGVVVRRATSTIERFDWRTAEMIEGVDEVQASVTPGAQLRVAASVDLIWIEEIDGSLVWAVDRWGLRALRKDAPNGPLLAESGEQISTGEGSPAQAASGATTVVENEPPEPDGDGVNDPPVANNDPVTARTGSTVTIDVTANDFDPDGEAIAVAEVGEADHGLVDIVSASRVSYLPEPGQVGIDQFRYAIVDGSGQRAEATVLIELLPVDAANQPPVGNPDVTQTRANRAVIVDVLTNDIDPERDALSIASFSPPDVGGKVSLSVGPSELPALRYEPPPRVSGTATFTYSPVDSLGAIGEPVEVRVEIAQPNAPNRLPVVRPDAVRIRRNVPALIPVLANDFDPDGDRMLIDIVQGVAPGLDARVVGSQIEVVVRAGAAELSRLSYRVDDGSGEFVIGSVLVVLIPDAAPNRPPVANADNETVVVGAVRTLEVLANDTDPDGDPLRVISVSAPERRTGSGTVTVRGNAVEYVAAATVPDDELIDQFTYRIDDGNGHEATGEVTIRVLAEAVLSPPYARDDSVTTEVDVPVTIDVLLNDGDPSGEPLSVVSDPGCAGGGSAVKTPDGRVMFTPPAATAGVFSCVYEVTNAQNLRAEAAILITVLRPTEQNDPPVVAGERMMLTFGETKSIDLLENDSDPDPGDRLRVVSISEADFATAELRGSVLTLTAGNEAGVSTVQYQVADNHNDISIGYLVVDVREPDPEPPVARDNRAVITGPGVPTVIDVLADDFDPDTELSDLRVESAEIVSGPASVTFADRTVTIDPSPEYVGDIVARYVVVDPDGETDSAAVVLTVLEQPNRPPEPVDDTASVVNGGQVDVAIAANDSDLDGDPLTYELVTLPDSRLGSADLVGTTLTFVAEPGASGVAVIEYSVSDGEATVNAFVSIEVLPCSQGAPAAPDVFLLTGYEQPIFVDLTTVARNGDVVNVGPPLGAPSGVYTPPAGENGNVTFSYEVRNACRLVDFGTVTIDVNQDPVGAPYNADIGRTQLFSIPISSLASDAEPLTIISLEAAPPWVSIVDGGAAVQVNPTGQAGRVDVVATVSDPGGLMVNVPIGINLINLAPVAVADQIRITRNNAIVEPLLNDSDPDGDAIALFSVPATLTFPNGQVGTITTLPGDRLRIDPGAGLGTATVAYTIVDALGLPSSEAIITVHVNTPPVAPLVNVLIEAGTEQTIDVPATDADNDPLILTITTDPSPLTVVVNGLSVTITAPRQAANQEIRIGYTVTDPFEGEASNEIVVTVSEPAPPVP